MGLLGALALSGCGSTGQPPAPSGPPVSAPAAGQPPAFASVVQGAQRHDGLLPTWSRQDKVWIELSPQLLGKPLFLSPKLASGIGEGGVLGGLMQSRWAQVGRPQWVEFRKVNQQVQLVAVNAAYTARSGTPQARAVQAAFSPSLIAAAPVVSAPEPRSGAVLVDASGLLLADWLGLGAHLQRQYRQGYAFDARHSHLLPARQVDDTTVFEVVQHFAAASVSTAAAAPAPGVPAPSLPRAVPDPRSLFVRVQHSLSALPEQPMAPRPADPRVGYFTTSVADFSEDLARTPRLHHINRWRLEKKEPSAALSEPVRPIVFWLDASIPVAYRATITEGVLAWNRAFEAIGFRNAIEVRNVDETASAGDTSFDTLATGRASIRWMTNAQATFGAIGPTHVDPRTGEILDADIALESLSTRATRQLRREFVLSGSGVDRAEDGDDASAHEGGACLHGRHAAEQLDWGLSQLTAGRPLDPDDPKVRAFVLAYLKDTTMHEVGHALGLRHNFRASRWRTAEELQDPTLTREHGIHASVMDYSPINLPEPGRPGGAPFQTTLGPYDMWAIEYGYRPLPAEPDAADRALRDIAQRSAEPAWAEALAYGTDEDAAFGDPQAQPFDQGRDPVAFARIRLAIVRDLVYRTERRVRLPSDDPDEVRRVVAYGLREVARTAQVLLRQVGGVVVRRDAPGARRDPVNPLPAAEQRLALGMLMDEWLAPQPVRVSPELSRRISPDFRELQAGGDAGLGGRLDVSLAEQQLSLQRAVLTQLMRESLADRLLDNADRTRDRERRPLMPQELLRGLQRTLWERQRALPSDLAAWRRNLQREHVARLAAGVLRPSSARADVRAAWLEASRDLLRHLRSRGAGDPLDQAHRRACIEALEAALRAPLVRGAP